MRAPAVVRMRPLVAVLAVVHLLAAGTPVLGAAAPVSSSGIEEAGRLARVPTDALETFGSRIDPEQNRTGLGNLPAWAPRAGTLIAIPGHRQLWQLFPHGGATAIAVRDLDTLAIGASFELDFEPQRIGGPTIGGEWIHAVDDTGGRLFLAKSRNQNTGVQEIAEIDLTTLEIVEHTFGDGPTFTHLGSLAHVDGALWATLGAAGGASAAGVLSTYLARFDLATGEASYRLLRACDGPYQATVSTRTLTSPPLVHGDFVYLACHRSGYAGLVVRMPLASALDPAGPEALVVGPPYLETVLPDPAGRRMFLVTNQGELWAFDLETMAFVGVVAAHAETRGTVAVGYGIDPASGRVLFQSPTFGFGVADGRFFPIPQARTLPDRAAAGQERIWIDPATGHAFLLEGSGRERADDYVIYDIGPAPVPPPPSDPDASTIDRAEEEGLTDARLFGSGRGYGSRVLFAKGISTVVPSPSVGLQSPIAAVINDHVNSKCGYTDRELIAGRVARAEYDTGSTAAEAIAVEIDDRSKVDLDRPSRCDVTARDTSGTEQFPGVFAHLPPLADNDSGEPRWDRRPAVCSASEGGAADESTGDDGMQPPLGEAHVACPLPGGELEAAATARLGGPVAVEHAATSTRIWRDGDGMHARVESVARGIDVAGVISIGEVRAAATSSSNGRPRGEPMSRYEYSIAAVTVDGTQICATSCQPQEVVDTLNQVAAGRAQFRLGAAGLDPALVEGTPGGALTAVQKSVQRQVSDQALVGDFTTEIPALEMVVYNDNFKWGRARQLYQFAGVSTAATYNIVLVPTFEPLDAGDPGAGPADEGFEPGTAVLPADGGAIDSAPSAPATLDTAPAAPTQPISDTTAAPTQPSGIVAEAVDAVARGVRFLLASPRQALLVATAWALLGLPGLLARRRQHLDALTAP